MVVPIAKHLFSSYSSTHIPLALCVQTSHEKEGLIYCQNSHIPIASERQNLPELPTELNYLRSLDHLLHSHIRYLDHRRVRNLTPEMIAGVRAEAEELVLLEQLI